MQGSGPARGHAEAAPFAEDGIDFRFSGKPSFRRKPGSGIGADGYTHAALAAFHGIDTGNGSAGKQIVFFGQKGQRPGCSGSSLCNGLIHRFRIMGGTADKHAACRKFSRPELCMFFNKEPFIIEGNLKEIGQPFVSSGNKGRRQG